MDIHYHYQHQIFLCGLNR